MSGLLRYTSDLTDEWLALGLPRTERQTDNKLALAVPAKSSQPRWNMFQLP